MLNTNLEKLLLKERGHGKFIYPAYGDYCLSNVPPALVSLLGIRLNRPRLPSQLYKGVAKKNTKKVILFLIDGFGYHQWLKYYKEHQFLKTFTKRGIVSPITTSFPATTPVGLATVSTGLTPQEHCVPEWIAYYKELDRLILTIMFSELDGEPDNLLKKKVSPRIIFKGHTIYQQLKKKGVRSISFTRDSLAQSVWAQTLYKGSTISGYTDLADLMVKLRRTMETRGRAYVYVYIPMVDAAAHQYGPYTDEHKAQMTALFSLLQKEFVEKLDKRSARETIVVITADHGQVRTDPKRTIYLNKYKKVTKNFQRNKKRKPIFPAGQPRDVFLYIKPNKLEETYSLLSRKLKGKATVIKTEDAVKEGLFGIGKPRKEFLERIGNLMILPHKNQTVWYKHTRKKNFNLLGHHGGLTPEEMLIPFAIAKLSDLQK